MRFVLPMFGKTMFVLKGIADTYLYYKVDGVNIYEKECKTLVIKYKYHKDNNVEWVYISNHDLCLKKIDIGNDYYLFVFKIPEKFEDDYQTFIEGRYSEFTPEYKNQIMMVMANTNKATYLNVINPTAYDKAELKKFLACDEEIVQIYSKINEDLETYDEGRT